jgi:ribosomal protein S18 acetylase RimI-like enzyme
MIVRPVTLNDFESIALIHKASYSNSHVTSFFSLYLLSQYYKAIWDKNPCAFIAITDSGEPVGFVIGGDDLDKPIQRFIRTHILALAMVLIQHPKFIFFRIADKLKKKSEQKNTAIPFQLLSIAVKKNGQSTGCGKLLLQAFEQKLLGENIKQYGLSVKKNNERAINFYKKNGFEIEFDTFTIRCYYKNIALVKHNT